MQKKTTQEKHTQIANYTMNYIYNYIDTDINIDKLANKFEISRVYFQNIFKNQIGKNIYEAIKDIRLYKASNLLLTNKSSTIKQIANMCGYSSQTSFIRAFRLRFNQTPKEWRNGGHKNYSNNILKDIDINFDEIKNLDKSEPKIVKLNPMKIYYLRNKGYSKESLKKTWQKIQAWIYTNNITNYKELAFYHDNPVITPANDCVYVAAVFVEDKIDLSNTNLPHFKISGGLYASFEISGVHGDILRLLQWVYQDWLPKSGFETTTNPAHTVLRQNHYTHSSGRFEATLYLPIQYV
ncbi:AraC family transcriptional regulator [Arcobacter arenosus]|jgi:AraC family transcriptional regulator|uniref:AraC family transcriptional regulator n=1 Tax=Arcobacter arenosus TaxID=2576037 RepID=A0A5R8Y1R8_9BACT|nr:AraC family transcriptional regulator [Arcobacter arenosus]TLP39285.1 AraC family transcriptional regulator [Arcobacter arenosus]